MCKMLIGHILDFSADENAAYDAIFNYLLAPKVSVRQFY